MKIRHIFWDRLHDPAPHVTSWRGRCTFCGHRVGHWEQDPKHLLGEIFVPPRPTREQPWRIPSEIVMRFRAMRRGE